MNNTTTKAAETAKKAGTTRNTDIRPGKRYSSANPGYPAGNRRFFSFPERNRFISFLSRPYGTNR